jgi:hypothetical protein
MSVIGLWSGKNYLKHAVMTPDAMGKPNTSDGGLGFFTTKIVLHNLGYRPLVRAYYDPNSNGSIFPMMEQFSGVTAGASSESPLDAVVPFYFFVDDVATTSVTFRTYGGSSLSGTFPFYYRIYIDPTL